MKKTSLLSLILTTSLLIPTLQAEDKPINIVFPPPKIVGTPVPIKMQNYEKPGKPAPILAPEGTVNIALKKKVTSSDAAPIVGELACITDGEKLSEDGYFVELAEGKQWVQIDLGKTTPIYALAVWHYHTQNRVYNSVVIQISDDEDFLTNVKTIYNNDHDNALGLGAGTSLPYLDSNLGKVFPVNKISGRYVRLYSKGNSSNNNNHYIEVEVYGTP